MGIRGGLRWLLIITQKKLKQWKHFTVGIDRKGHGCRKNLLLSFGKSIKIKTIVRAKKRAVIMGIAKNV
jgi:hypothetical protein